MTKSALSHEQVWYWKANILGGLLIFRDKQRAVMCYLQQAGRTFTQDQLQHETLSRWNGGTGNSGKKNSLSLKDGLRKNLQAC